MGKKKRQLSPTEWGRQVLPQLSPSTLRMLVDLGERLEAGEPLGEPTDEEIKAFDELPLATRQLLADIEREQEKRIRKEKEQKEPKRRKGNRS